ncbi:leucine-rich repeat-containing protein 15-like [Mytilus californianus]|uniref:leucine-rich repeat-containing protein 15-like n=1 Tax=Mytilus californianus TaxID=6549 RepID=UPI0022462DA3|nr:leucine-rich repeat-containing protein 15-like [Mytilus californianus]
MEMKMAKTLLFVMICTIRLKTALLCPTLCNCNEEYYIYCDSVSLNDNQLPFVLADVSETATYIDFSYNLLRNISVNLFTRFQQLKYLIFSDNNIQNIDPGSFDQLPNLFVLDLRNNKLQTIGSNILSAQTILSRLYLQNNDIESIHPDAFRNLFLLKELHLQRNKLTTLPLTVFRDMPMLTSLNLFDNKLEFLADDTFSGLISLRKLFLQNNVISNLSQKALHGLSKVRALYIHGNRILGIEKIHFDGLRSSIQILNISDNQIAEIKQDTFKDMYNLKTLDLTNNEIHVIENFSFELLSLDNLLLQGNSLTHLWKTYFTGAKKIMCLDISYNKLTDISNDAFDSLQNSIRILKLNNNQIKHIHVGMFRGMKYLQELNLANNQIINIDSNGFEDLQKLKVLNLHKNQLESVNGKFIRGLASLKVLYLDCNPLKTAIDFSFINPIRITMNLTLLAVIENSVNISWPFKHGSQIYWSVTVICAQQTKNCLVDRKPEYFPPFTESVYLANLSPSSTLYICVSPIFINSDISIKQCLYVNTLAKAASTAENPTLTTAPVSTGKQVHPIHFLYAEFIYIYFILIYLIHVILN